MPEKLRVLCVDDDAATNRLHAIVLGMEDDMEVVGLATDASQVLPEIRRARPDVVLLDLRLRSSTSHGVLEEIVRSHPDVRVVVLSGYDEPATVSEVIAAGASGFVKKGVETGHIPRAIRAAMRAERPAPSAESV